MHLQLKWNFTHEQLYNIFYGSGGKFLKYETMTLMMSSGLSWLGLEHLKLGVEFERCGDLPGSHVLRKVYANCI